MTVQQTITPEIVSSSIELDNFMASINDNLRFHIIQLLSKCLESNQAKEAGDIEKEGKQWLTNILLIMLTNLGFSMNAKERVQLMSNLELV